MRAVVVVKPITAEDVLNVQSSPLAPLFAVYGDSISAAPVARYTSTLKTNSPRGIGYWLPALTGQRVQTRADLNFGVSGETSTQIAARLPNVLGSDASIVITMNGRNDLSGTIGDALFNNYVAQNQTMWDAILKSGKQVWALPMLSAEITTQTTREMLWRFQAWVKQQAFSGRKNFTVLDPNPYWVNPTDANGAAKSGYAYDDPDTHPTLQGAYYVTKPIAAWVNNRLPPIGVTCASVADLYSTTNRLGNLSANGMLTGTTGTTSGTGGTGGAISGNVPTSSVLAHIVNGGSLTNLTTTTTQPTLSDGRPAFKMALAASTYTGAGSSAVNAASRVTLRQTLGTLTRFAAGDKIFAEAQIDIDANAAHCTGIETQLQITDGGTGYVVGDGGCDGDPIPTEAHTVTHRTPSHRLGAQPTVVQLEVRCYLRNGAQSDLALGATVSGVTIRKES